MANTPDQEENDEKSSDSEMTVDGEGRRDDDNGDHDSNLKAISITSANHGKSDYSHRRDANIAQNKLLLGELGFLVKETSKGLKKTGKGGKGKKKEVEASMSESSARTGR
jgi:hypothetical protein